jgi:helix-turn-helix protein
MRDSKTSKLLKLLQTGKTVTPLQAWVKFGLYRVSDSVMKLRRRGHDIETVPVKKGKVTYGMYKMRGV